MICFCFSGSGSYDAVILPPGEKFNRNFFIDEVSERYHEDRSETREKNRLYDMFCRLATLVHI
jgi:hypothetical protein